MRNILNRWFFFNDHRVDHVRALDGLRGIAVLLVLLSHASIEKMYFLDNFIFLGIGKGGVFLFYALSAYLLDKQITIALRNQSADSFFWKRYFLRRVLRIYPLFILALFVFWSISSMGIKTQITDGMDFIRHLFLIEGRGVFWSIPVEFKYYFLSPFILLICHRYLHWDLKKIILFLGVLAIASIVVSFFIYLPKISTFRHIIIFLTGTAIAIYEITQRYPDWMNRIGKFIGVLSFLALGIFLCMNLIMQQEWFGITTNNGRKGLIIYSILSGIALFGAIYDTGLYKRFLELKILRYIGVISFSIYLFHMPVIFLLTSDMFSIPHALRVYFFFGGTFLMSTVTYLLIERPIARKWVMKRNYTPANSV
ncbi:MAG: acyltransferase [Saprospiraceae bacterium]